MATRLTRLKAQNYRSLAEVDLPLGSINVLFGPNGAGKSTLLDTIWFVRDCAIRSVSAASSSRDHGIGLLFDGAGANSPIVLMLETEGVRYELTFSFSSGRIEPYAGEKLESLLRRDGALIHRLPGTARAAFHPLGVDQANTIDLREPEKFSLGRYLDYTPSDEAAELDQILHDVRSYRSRSFHLHRLKRDGSQAGYETKVSYLADNLWSVLRNLDSRRRLDDRYDTIIGYMRKAFPRSFEDLVIEPTGPNSLYAKFIEKERREPILASGVSDGHVQLLILLTALFSEGRDRYSLLLVDEPETSLHPWAQAVFAEAMIEAARDWNKQMILATHSPVLISHFTADQVLSVETRNGRTEITPISAIDGIQDLLEQYAAGSLFLSGLIASQTDKEIIRPEVQETAR
ncbi:AAA family ATPase [Aquisphaera insulae]|uniref:AAA family ATPase n=1 Tax=Aquisphaera insulae TaxID=2712864 RepID=UPI0013ED6BEF|nr:AAA family ATPase [Aquisphaera insulae]